MQHRWLGILCLAALPAGAESPGAALSVQAPFVVVIDAGHGGRQAGAKGPGRLLEKSVSLDVAKKVGRLAHDRLGARVVYTRERDVEVALPVRVEKANDAAADVFVSIHANSMPTDEERQTTRGIETFFLSADASDEGAQQTADRENEEGAIQGEEPTDQVSAILDDLARTAAHTDSSRLAYAVQRQLSADLGVPDRGVKQAPFRVLMGAKMPAVLVEIGFISNPREGKLLGDSAYQDRIARSIVSAVGAFRRDLVARDNVGSANGAPLSASSEPRREAANAKAAAATASP